MATEASTIPDTDDGRIRARIFADLAKRVFISKLDSTGFDPRDASDEELRARALPPRPDAKLVPRAFANWVRLMSPPLRIVEWRPVEEYFEVSMLARQSFVGATTKTFVAEASENWSGAVVGAEIGGLCTSVHGSWAVPHPEPPPEARNGAKWLDGAWFSSTWVGLDGHNSASVTMPQIGTQQIVRAKSASLTVEIVAWWQWWLRDQLINRQIDLPLVLQSGHQAAALVTVLDEYKANFFLKNLNTGQAVAFNVDAPALPGSPPEALEQQTAEWVMERQTQPDGTDLLPFNNYKLCQFGECAAVASDAAGIPADVDLSDAGLIEMVDWTTPLDPGRVISRPRSPTSSTSFETVYVPGLP